MMTALEKTNHDFPEDDHDRRNNRADHKMYPELFLNSYAGKYQCYIVLKKDTVDTACNVKRYDPA